MATAEYVTKVHAVCTRTGNLAQYSFRTAAEDDLVMLGEKAYEPLSRAAFFKEKQAERKKGAKGQVTQLTIDLNALCTITVSCVSSCPNAPK